MAYNNLETTLALESLRAPLDPFPVTSQEKFLNDMRIKYRTFYLEYSIDHGVVMLPKMFAEDFGDELCRIVTLVDSRDNHFEVLVEKINDDVYFTRGWAALRDFYDIRTGAWMVLIYSGYGYFGINLHDRFQQPIVPPTFTPPMRLVIDKYRVPSYFLDEMPESIDDLSYSHSDRYFDVAYEKVLTYYDVSEGYLMLPYEGFGEFAIDQTATSIKLVDDCGNAWQCSSIFVTFPCKYFKIGGQWRRLVAAKRLYSGQSITFGAQPDAHNDTLYLMFDS